MNMGFAKCVAQHCLIWNYIRFVLWLFLFLQWRWPFLDGHTCIKLGWLVVFLIYNFKQLDIQAKKPDGLTLSVFCCCFFWKKEIFFDIFWFVTVKSIQDFHKMEIIFKRPVAHGLNWILSSHHMLLSIIFREFDVRKSSKSTDIHK